MLSADFGMVSSAWHRYARQRYWSDGGVVAKYRCKHVQAVSISPHYNIYNFSSANESSRSHWVL